MGKAKECKVRGFSLLELTFVIVILSIIAGIGSRIASVGFNAYFTNQNLTDADWQARLALDRMTKDLHHIISITTASSSQLSFTDIYGNNVTYQLSGTALVRNGQVLADGVSGLTFSYFDSNLATTNILANIVYIAFTLNITQGSTNSTLRTTVYIA